MLVIYLISFLISVVFAIWVVRVSLRLQERRVLLLLVLAGAVMTHEIIHIKDLLQARFSGSTNLEWLNNQSTAEAVEAIVTLLILASVLNIMVLYRKMGDHSNIVITAAKLGTWNLDLKKKTFTFNEQWARMMGYEPEEIDATSEGWEKLVHPEDIPDLLKIVHNQTTKGATGYCITEYRVRKKDGSWMWVYDAGMVTEREQSGKARRMVGINLDITDRKDAEKARLESKRRYRAVVEDLTEMVLRFSLDEEILFVNNAFAKRHNKDPDEIIGMKLKELYSDAGYKQTMDAVVPLNIDCQVSESTNEALYPDGTRHWHRWVNRALFGEDGQILEYQTVGRDVTAETENQIALVKGREELRELLNTIPECVALIDSEGCFQIINKYGQDLLGITEADYLGKTYRGLAESIPEQKALLLECNKKLQEVCEKRKVVCYEQKIVDENGQERIFDIKKIPILDGDQVKSVVSVSQERTDVAVVQEQRRLAWEASERARDQLNKLLESASLIHGQHVEQKVIQLVADAVHDAGWGRVYVYLYHDWEICLDAQSGMTPDEIELLRNGRVSKEVRRSRFGKEVESFRVSRSYYIPSRNNKGEMFPDVILGQRTYSKSDSWHHDDIAYVPIYGSDRHVLGVILIDEPDDGKCPDESQFRRFEFFADAASGVLEEIRLREDRQQVIEKLAQQRIRLTRSNHDLEKFAHVVSHDLREPARMVLGFTKMVARRHGENIDAKAMELLEFAIDGAERMQSMIDDMLIYANIRSSNQPFELAPMKNAVDTALARLLGSINNAEARIDIQDLPVLEMDCDQISTVFENLLENAIKFRAKEPLRVTVGSHYTEGSWEVYISDNGVGVRRDEAEKIFDMFYCQPSTAGLPGTGIGLAVCKRIIERHNGRIWCDTTDNKGTTIRFVIPEHQHSDVPPREAEEIATVISETKSKLNVENAD